MLVVPLVCMLVVGRRACLVDFVDSFVDVVPLFFIEGKVKRVFVDTARRSEERSAVRVFSNPHLPKNEVTSL